MEEAESHGNAAKTVPESPDQSKNERKHMVPDVTPLNATAPAVGRRMVFDTQEGEAMFTFPENLSEDSVSDLEEWFALVVKRLRRAPKQ
jgi:hypothetical protein